MLLRPRVISPCKDIKMKYKSQIERYLAQVAAIDSSGFHSWVLEKGKLFLPDAVVEIAPPMIEQLRPEPKGCFLNSYRVATNIEELSYFEGFYLPGIGGNPLFPMEHAWNVRKWSGRDVYSGPVGNVLDFTAQGGEIEVLEWFGIELTPDQVKPALLEGCRTPLLRLFIEEKNRKVK